MRFILRAFLREHQQPDIVLGKLNAYLCESHRLFREGLNTEGDDAPICLTLAVVHAATGDGTMASAGMEPLLLARADGSIDVVTAQGLLLGIETGQDYELTPFHLEHGDTILMTTDGITEARQGIEFLGTEGLQRLVTETHPLDTLELKAQAILTGARSFGDTGFRDDVCIVLARRQ